MNLYHWKQILLHNSRTLNEQKKNSAEWKCNSSFSQANPFRGSGPFIWLTKKHCISPEKSQSQSASDHLETTLTISICKLKYNKIHKFHPISRSLPKCFARRVAVVLPHCSLGLRAELRYQTHPWLGCPFFSSAAGFSRLMISGGWGADDASRLVTVELCISLDPMLFPRKQARCESVLGIFLADGRDVWCKGIRSSR